MGSLKNKINELEERIKNNRKAIAELDEMFYKFSGPKGYPTGTSWQDYDCIRGGNKEMDLFRYVTERERLKKIIEIDDVIYNLPLTSSADLFNSLYRLIEIIENGNEIIN